LLYSQKDETLARILYERLTDRGFKIWYAPEHGRGPIALGIATAIQQSTIALCALGPGGLGQFESRIELNSLLTTGKIQIFPVWLPGFSPEVLQDDPLGPVLLGIFPIVLKNFVDVDQVAWGRLENRLLEESTIPLAPAKSVADPPDPTDTPRLTRDTTSLVDLATAVASQGLTVFVGSTLPERHQVQVLDLQTVASDLLGELGLLEKLALPAPDAAFLYSLKKGLAASEGIARHMSNRSLGEPDTYRRLAAFFGRLLSLKRPSQYRSESNNTTPPLVVTTNLDMALERSFLVEGIPFSRLIVQVDRKNGSIRHMYAEITKVETLANGRLRLYWPHQPTAESIETRLQEELQPSKLSAYKGDWQRLTAGIQTFETYFRARELNRCLKEHWSRTARRLPEDKSEADKLVLGLTPPVIVKICGCGGITNGYSLRLDDYYALARNPFSLPSVVRSTMTSTACFFLGYHLTEPLFLFLYENFLRDGFRLGETRTRLAVIQPQVVVVDGQDRFDLEVAAELLRDSETLFQIRLTFQEPGNVLNQLVEAIETGERSWADY
jgi:hypothetical protein